MDFGTSTFVDFCIEKEMDDLIETYSLESRKFPTHKLEPLNRKYWQSSYCLKDLVYIGDYTT